MNEVDTFYEGGLVVYTKSYKQNNSNKTTTASKIK